MTSTHRQQDTPRRLYHRAPRMGATGSTPHLHLLATSGAMMPTPALEHLRICPGSPAPSPVAVASADDAAPDAQDGRGPSVGRCVFPATGRAGDQRAKGEAVPTQARLCATHVAKYVVSPIAVRRIDRYDGERVTYHCRSHRTDRMEHETVTVDRVYWPDGAARDAQRLQAHPLLRRALRRHLPRSRGSFKPPALRSRVLSRGRSRSSPG